MRRLHRAITALLILLCLGGVLFGVKFMKREQQLAARRQEEIIRVTRELEPINEQRRKWEEQDREWQRTLAQKQKGRTCVLLGFDYTGRELYDTIFDMMEQYGFRGTFAMRNGSVPSWEMRRGDESGSSEQIQEMLDAGWDYALWVDDAEVLEEETEETRHQRDFSDEFGEEILAEVESESQEDLQETEVQTEQSAEDQTDMESLSFLEQVQGAADTLAANGYTAPVTLFCSQEQYQETTDAALAELGFTMVSVKEPQGFPVVERGEEEQGELLLIPAAEYSQSDEDLEVQLAGIVARQQSVAILIHDVVKIAKDTERDLNFTAFTSLLNYLRELESDRKINVLTYSEYQQYEQLRQESYEKALAEYTQFREEMLKAVEELDIQEAAIAKKLRETETVETAETQEITETQGTEKAQGTEEQIQE